MKWTAWLTCWIAGFLLFSVGRSARAQAADVASDPPPVGASALPPRRALPLHRGTTAVVSGPRERSIVWTPRDRDRATLWTPPTSRAESATVRERRPLGFVPSTSPADRWATAQRRGLAGALAGAGDKAAAAAAHADRASDALTRAALTRPTSAHELHAGAARIAGADRALGRAERSLGEARNAETALAKQFEAAGARSLGPIGFAPNASGHARPVATNSSRGAGPIGFRVAGTQPTKTAPPALDEGPRPPIGFRTPDAAAPSIPPEQTEMRSAAAVRAFDVLGAAHGRLVAADAHVRATVARRDALALTKPRSAAEIRATAAEIVRADRGVAASMERREAAQRDVASATRTVENRLEARRDPAERSRPGPIGFAPSRSKARSSGDGADSNAREPIGFRPAD